MSRPGIEVNTLFTPSETALPSLPIFYSQDRERLSLAPYGLPRGSYDAIRFSDSLGIFSATIQTSSRPVIARTSTNGGLLWLSFFVKQRERSEINIDGEPILITLEEGQMGIGYLPPPFQLTIPPNSFNHNVSILAEPEFLSRCLVDCSSRTRRIVEEALRAPETPFAKVGPMPPAIIVALQQVSSCPYCGPLRRLYLEGKTLELLSMEFCELFEGATQVQADESLTPGESERIREARRILIEHMRDPPTLHELARQVGINVKKLKTGFKSEFGRPPFACLRDARLERGRRLLEEGELNVSEVSYEIGYNSLSHFALAFKKAFGVPPHLMRKSLHR